MLFRSGPQYTYGEIEVIHFTALLKIASPKRGGVFWDLGSGTGKALIAAALGRNEFSKICGVEELDNLYNTSVKVIDNFCKKTKTDKQKFLLVKGDMTKIDWSDADVIYISSICFPDELIKELEEKGKYLKKGTKIISLKNWNQTKMYNVIMNMEVKMTWGKNGVYVLEKL